MKKKTLFGLGLSSALLFTLASTTTAKADSSKDLNYYFPTDITTLDISKNTDTYSATVLGNSGANLLRIDKKGKPVLDLAKSIKHSDDGLTYTLVLKDNLKWSDGSDLTANDFVYTWQRIVDPKTASQYAYLATDVIKNADDINSGKNTNMADLGVKADGNTITFTLAHPAPQFEYLLAFSNFMPQKESFVTKAGKKYGTSSEQQIYSGPYVFKGWNGSNNSFKLVKNKYYWNAKAVKTETINLKVIKKPESALQLYKQGKLDAVSIIATPSMYAANKKNKDVKSIPMARTDYIEYNQTGQVKALANKKIRQALNLATNRAGLVNSVTGGSYKKATGLAPTGLAVTDTGQDLAKFANPGYTYNLKEAKKVWKEGLAELGQSKITLKFEADADNPTRKSMVDYLKGAWEKALPGLTIEEKFVPFKQRLQDQQTQNFDIILGSWGGDYPEGSTFYGLFSEGSGYNSGLFANQTYIDTYKKATTTDALNEKERANDYKILEKTLMEEANINPIAFQSNESLVNPDVKGVVRNSTGTTDDWTYAYKK